MSINYRVKKKKRNPRDRRITLDAHHNKKLTEFQNLHAKLPSMKTQLRKLENDKQKLEKENKGISLLSPEIGKKMYQLNQKIRETRNMIYDIESGKMEDKYYAMTAHILYQYYDNIRAVAQKSDNDTSSHNTGGDNNASNNKKKSVVDFFAKPPPNNARANSYHNQANNIPLRGQKSFSSTKIYDFVDMTKRSRQANLLEKYTKLINPTNYRPARHEKRDIDMCPACDCEMTLVQSEGILVCQQCGREESIVIDSEKPSYKDPPPEAGEFTYKRIGRLEEWLTQYQASETTEIPQEVLDNILMEIKKERIQNMACLTIEKVRMYLKKLKLNNYYEHIPHIIYCLNGLPTPRFTRGLEEQLRVMFREIQEIFDQVCPAWRTNFLSYSYLLAKLLELLGEDEHKKYFRFHKNREKIYDHDQVWKKICKILRWQYIRTV